MRLENVNKPYPLAQLEAISDQSFLIRYSKCRVIRHQTVAEHVGRGCQIAFMACYDMKWSMSLLDYSVFLGDVMCRFALHDNAESVVGDMTSDIKVQQANFSVLEESVFARLWSRFLLVPRNQTVVDAVVDAVDIAELVMFGIDEVRMGNDDMKDILQRGVDILAARIDKIHTLVNMDITQTLDAIIWKGRHHLAAAQD